MIRGLIGEETKLLCHLSRVMSNTRDRSKEVRPFSFLSVRLFLRDPSSSGSLSILRVFQKNPSKGMNTSESPYEEEGVLDTGTVRPSH